MSVETTKKIEDFFNQYRLRTYSKGQVLILNGDNTSYIYYLIKGKVKEYDVTYRGDEIILNVFKPPAFFPMSMAVNKTVNQYIYEAESDIEIRQAPSDEVVAFIKSNPDVMFDLLTRVYKGVDGLLGRVVHLMTGSAKKRLMHELLLEAQRFGIKQINGGLSVTTNEKDLAARTALSRETVSREINKLKAENLITIRNKDIFIENLAELEAKLSQEN